MVSAPGSPSRLISLSQNSSFTLLPQLSGAVGSQVSHGPSSLVGNSVVAVNTVNRVLPQSQSSAMDKSRLGNYFSDFHRCGRGGFLVEVGYRVSGKESAVFRQWMVQRVRQHGSDFQMGGS